MSKKRDYTFEEWDWEEHRELLDEWMQGLHNLIEKPLGRHYDFASKLEVAKKMKFIVVFCYKASNPVGYFMYHQYPNSTRAFVLDLFIDSSLQKKAVGVTLCKEIIEYLKAKGIKQLQCSTLSSNTNAIKVFEHIGFKPYRVILEMECSL